MTENLQNQGTPETGSVHITSKQEDLPFLYQLGIGFLASGTTIAIGQPLNVIQRRMQVIHVWGYTFSRSKDHLSK